jgi:hypothetical protein
MTRPVLILAAILVTGCSPPMLRGDFSLLSTEDLSGKYEVLSKQAVAGHACFDMLKASVFVGEGVFDRVVREALAGQPEGAILVNAEFVDDGTCIDVTGIPAKLK